MFVFGPQRWGGGKRKGRGGNIGNRKLCKITRMMAHIREHDADETEHLRTLEFSKFEM